MKNTFKKSLTMILASAMAVNGMIAFASAAEKTDTETVYGDIDCNGAADITDLSGLSLYLIGDCKLNETALKNADINRDGKVDLTDLAEFKMQLAKQSVSVMNAETRPAAYSVKTDELCSKYSDSDPVLEDGPLYDKINEQAEKLRADDIYAAQVEAEFGERRPVKVFRPVNYTDGSYLDMYMAVFENKIEAETVSPYMFDRTTGEQISISDIFGDSFAEYDGNYVIVESNRKLGYVVLRSWSDYCSYVKVNYDFSTLNPKYDSFADFQSMVFTFEDSAAHDNYSVTAVSK